MNFDRLNLEELSRVRALLQKKLPLSAMMFNIVSICLKENGGCPEEPIEIYAYNGAKDENGLFIVAFILPREDGERISVIFSPEDISEDMIHSFIRLYDWSKTYLFASIFPSFALQLEKIAEGQKGKTWKGACADMYLPIEEALGLDLGKEPELAEEFELGTLRPEHASKVRAHWKFGKDVGESFMATSISLLGGTATAAVFKKSETNQNDVENLVSWISFRRQGTLFALHTLEKYRGKGLARWTMEAASKRVAEQGLIPLCEIEGYNVTSRRLVERIGFRYLVEVFWMDYKPHKIN